MAEPQQHLTSASQLACLCEHESDRILYTPVGVHLELAVTRPAEPHRKSKLQFTSSGLLTNRFERTLAQQIQFKLAHRALEAEQQPVIQDTGIINSVRVYNKRPNKAAEFNQMMPVAAVARQS